MTTQGQDRLKPTMSMCVNLTDYHRQTIKWQADRIKALEEALRMAELVLIHAAGGNTIYEDHYLEEAAKIASVLDNTEESRDE